QIEHAERGESERDRERRDHLKTPRTRVLKLNRFHRLLPFVHAALAASAAWIAGHVPGVGAAAFCVASTKGYASDGLRRRPAGAADRGTRCVHGLCGDCTRGLTRAWLAPPGSGLTSTAT